MSRIILALIGLTSISQYPSPGPWRSHNRTSPTDPVAATRLMQAKHVARALQQEKSKRQSSAHAQVAAFYRTLAALQKGTEDG